MFKYVVQRYPEHGFSNTTLNMGVDRLKSRSRMNRPRCYCKPKQASLNQHQNAPSCSRLGSPKRGTDSTSVGTAHGLLEENPLVAPSTTRPSLPWQVQVSKPLCQPLRYGSQLIPGHGPWGYLPFGQYFLETSVDLEKGPWEIPHAIFPNY